MKGQPVVIHADNLDVETEQDTNKNHGSIGAAMSTAESRLHQPVTKKMSFHKGKIEEYNKIQYGHSVVDHYDHENHEDPHFSGSTNFHEQRPLQMHQTDVEFYKSGQAQISIKDKTANPGALGLLGFGLTTFLLNLHNAGAFPMNSMILSMGICYGGLAQIIAGILEFQRGNLFGMIAFMSYGFFWWSLCITVILPKMYGIAPADHTSMGCYLFIWGVFSLVMMIGTFVKKLPYVLSYLFFTVVVLFWLLAARHWADSEELEQAAGIEGVICGLSAIYLAAAEIINDLGGRHILYVGARK